MELTRVIIGPVLTEKAERMKASRTYMLKIAPEATKIDIQNALKRFYDVEVTSVRVLWVRSKHRDLGMGKQMCKRSAWKKAQVTLHPKSKVLDLAQFKTN